MILKPKWEKSFTIKPFYISIDVIRHRIIAQEQYTDIFVLFDTGYYPEMKSIKFFLAIPHMAYKAEQSKIKGIFICKRLGFPQFIHKFIHKKHEEAI
jgi:acetate kinase